MKNLASIALGKGEGGALGVPSRPIVPRPVNTGDFALFYPSHCRPGTVPEGLSVESFWLIANGFKALDFGIQDVKRSFELQTVTIRNGYWLRVVG